MLKNKFIITLIQCGGAKLKQYKIKKMFNKQINQQKNNKTNNPKN